MILAVIGAVLAGISSPLPNANQALQPIPFTEVKIDDAFWSPKQKVNREVSIPHTFEMCEKTPRMKNFELAAIQTTPGHKGYVFDDSDIYKSLEAAAYALATDHDPKLDAKVDEWIAKVGAAQRPDGYLDTAYSLGRLEKRFTNLADDHEMYCAGHLFEAAVAHYQATGKKNLLNIATKVADLLCKTFGDGPGQRMGYCGHPEVELALVKLWRATGQEKYLKLCEFFIYNRGNRFFADEKHIPKERFDGTYWLDDVPITDHKEIKGHAVRAAYLFSGTADVASLTGDAKLRTMLDRVWKNTVYKRVFVTGGIGPSGSNEGFTVDYDLPNRSAYQETCASVAMILWNHRMGLMEGNAKYWDWVERALYNGFLSGVSLKGDTFFYVNPLASTGNHHRNEWFGCACCPPNVTRTLASLGQYVYAKSSDALYVNLFVQSQVATPIGDETAKFRVETKFPWEGKVVVKPLAATKGELGLKLRVPDWCPGSSLKVNGAVVAEKAENGYFTVRRKWSTSDRVELSLDMPVQRIQAHPEVKDDLGLIAIQRGPIIYCLEGIDQTAALDEISVPLESQFSATFEPKLLNGVVVLRGNGIVSGKPNWKNSLYQPVQNLPTKVMAVPYYAWDNRKASPMEVWLRATPKVYTYVGPEQDAQLSLSYRSGNAQPEGIRDGKEVTKSNSQPGELCHFWPHKGTTEWVQYTWKTPITVTGSKVFWFDDTGAGECRLPESWEIQYLDGTQWKPVKGDKYDVAMDKWCTVNFQPVKTTALRLAVKLKPNWAAGIHEWHVIEQED